MRTKIKSIFKIVVVICFGMLINSCLDNDDSFSAYTDVFVKKEKIENVTKYAKVCYAYSFSQINSVDVTLPDETNLELDEVENNYFFDSSDFEETFPQTGTYYFTTTYEGYKTFDSFDILESNELDLPEITSILYDNDTESLVLEWNDVTDADAYLVRMYSQDEELIYDSQILLNINNEFSFNASGSSNWYEDPVDGTTYSVALTAVLFDSEAVNGDIGVNIQCYSISRSDIVWNPAI